MLLLFDKEKGEQNCHMSFTVFPGSVRSIWLTLWPTREVLSFLEKTAYPLPVGGLAGRNMCVGEGFRRFG